MIAPALVSNDNPSGKGVAVYAVFPHPDNPDRYFTVLGGSTPDAMAGASHFSLQLLPGYLVFTQDKMLDWGFWDNAWKHPISWLTDKAALAAAGL